MALAELPHQPTSDALRPSEPSPPRREVSGITIDGEFAPERDDGFHVESVGRWDRVIHVSIADPTEAFDVGSHQDQLARRRGVSLYFDNSVVPMIDGSQRHSLDSGSPRPAVTISFPVSGRAHVGRPTIERTVFRNRGMITYDQADQMLAQDGEFTQVLRDAYGLAQMLLRR